MNWYLLAAGLTAAVVSAIHIVAGHVDPVRPLLASSMADVPKRTMHAVWHMVSVDLVATASTLLAVAWWQPVGFELVAVLTAVRYAAYSVVFVVIALRVPGRAPLLRLPQWILLAPVAILAGLGGW
ncbi:hypothetical protein ACFVJ5_07385 [Nocardia sp. NPDC127606]|uniref:hypothetical protein n=1 Tax=Nocardia sp. NPDC127606 TaxID=3345406 RepID=UPI00363A20EA